MAPVVRAPRVPQSLAPELLGQERRVLGLLERPPPAARAQQGLPWPVQLVHWCWAGQSDESAERPQPRAAARLRWPE